MRQRQAPWHARRPCARSQRQDPNPHVQSEALFYLAAHGERSDLEAFLRRLDSRNQSVGEAARAGITRFAEAAQFPRIRALLAVPHGGVHRNVQATLAALTFGDSVPQRTPEQWDAWYAGQRAATRVDWARQSLEALLRPKPGDRTSPFRSLASISYLADQGPTAFRADFDRAADSRSAAVRIEAARAIARFDRPRAVALLIREFDSRFLSACSGANEALNTLFAQRRGLDCADPDARRRAKEAWLRIPSHLISRM